jgi:hypothetical protein
LTRKPTNIAASVSQRLLQRSQSLGEDYQLTLQRYAIERLLFRLSQSPAHDRFVLKGAMLYLVWGGEIYRPTRDLDLLGYGPDSAEAVNDCFRSLCSIEVKDDGLVFLPGTVRSEKIRDAAEYGGLRVRLEARLDKARIHIQVDIGLATSSFPAPRKRRFPSFSKGLLRGFAPTRGRASSPRSFMPPLYWVTRTAA